MWADAVHIMGTCCGTEARGETGQTSQNLTMRSFAQHGVRFVNAHCFQIGGAKAMTAAIAHQTELAVLHALDPK